MAFFNRMGTLLTMVAYLFTSGISILRLLICGADSSKAGFTEMLRPSTSNTDERLVYMTLHVKKLEDWIN
jgi:hypothetical protein